MACTATQRFQSTPSVWRETAAHTEQAAEEPFQSTPSVWRETADNTIWTVNGAISIHSLRVEGDRQPQGCPRSRYYFNPLPPCGGRPGGAPSPSTEIVYFNPLPPCGGRLRSWRRLPQRPHFNPLPPCGGRQSRRGCCCLLSRFQSTPSVWRETKCNSIRFVGGGISIHSLRVEGDQHAAHFRPNRFRFQSTPSVWRETFCGTGQ